MNEKIKMSVRRLVNPKKWANGLFWSWNLIFLAFMFLGFAPQIVPEMITGVRTGDLPATFLIYAIILTSIPALAMILGYIRLRRAPAQLFALGYGVEGPLMLLLALRFFVVRQATPGVTLLLGTAALGVLGFLWQLLDRKIDQRSPLAAHVRLICLTLLLIVGLYGSLWLAFYAVPLVAQSGQLLSEFVSNAWRGLIELDWANLVEGWRWIPFAVLGFILLIYSSTLFALMPLALSILYGQAWWRSLRAILASYTRPRAVALTTGVIVLFAALFVLANQQPQQKAFALLETAPVTPAEAQALQAQESRIRRGLLNAYLARQRYLSASGGMEHIKEIYDWAFDLRPKQTERVRSLYEIVSRPVIYDTVAEPKIGQPANALLEQEAAEAAELYEAYFDQTILDGERETVIRAVRSTWSVGQARAAWQAVDDREIYLTRQEISLSEKGDWAELELYEVYQNQTGQRQEVVYYFSLPELAVITGVWLGDSANRSQRHPYRVSPRGAAQELYKSQVQIRMDPALVEQIGPRQYRLRVFPVEPLLTRWDGPSASATIEAGPPLHMWLTWRVLASEAGWALPQLAEKRNVYWDEKSVRLYDGQPLAVESQAWLPASLPATSSVRPIAHRVDFPNGQSVFAQPAANQDVAAMGDDLRLAVVVDRSRSMLLYAKQVEAALTQLSQLGAAVDVYLTASDYLGQEPSRLSLADVDAAQIEYAGGQNAASLLNQFGQLQADAAYDAVLVLTDGTGYELDDSDIDVPIPDAPVWMIHLGGQFPLGYDDATLEAIQASGGGVSGSLDEGLARLAVGLAARNVAAPSGELRDWIDGYNWISLPTEMVSALPGELAAIPASDDGFASLAARQLILAEMVRQRGDLAQAETLDQLHEIAIEQSIVTPYSSMIVLVNEAQQRQLNELESRGDRYEREYDEVGETPVNITGVPEPEEWLLLALAAGMLIWYLCSNRRQPQTAGWTGS